MSAGRRSRHDKCRRPRLSNGLAKADKASNFEDVEGHRLATVSAPGLLESGAADLLAQVQRVVSSARPLHRPPAAYLRVRTAAGVRDVLLGDESRIEHAVPVLDWQKAPLAAVFFEAREDEDYELEVERRTLEGTVLRRALLDFEDGDLVGITNEEYRLERSGSDWISRPVPGSPLRARGVRARRRLSTPLVVDLDDDQRAAVQRPAEQSLLVLGDAGYGKTTVALHRLVHLQREAASRKRPFKSLVLLPTEGLRRLTALALERLGAKDVEVCTFENWIAAQGRAVFADLPTRTSRTASTLVSRIKRHPALRRVLAEVARGTEAMRELDEVRPGEYATRRDLLHLFGDRALLDLVVDASGGGLSGRARDEVLAHSRLQFSRTSEQRHAHVDAARLATLDGRAIDDATPMQDADTIDPEDFAVLFELNRLKTGSDRGPRGSLAQYDLVVLDEAQEFAPIELAVIGRAVRSSGSILIAGDEKQQVDETTVFRGWRSTLDTLSCEDAETIHLTESYRCPPQVEALARSLFRGRVQGWNSEEDDLVADAVVCRGSQTVSVHRSSFAHPIHRCAVLVDALSELLTDDPTSTIAVIMRSAAAARQMHRELNRGVTCHLGLDGDIRFKPGLQVTCVDEIKGLEFDTVVLPDVTPSSYADTDEARKALYVAVTRTTHQLWLCTAGAWSPLV